jgi:hypothetical protein
MNKVKVHSVFPVPLDIPTEKNVDVYIDCFDDSPMPPYDIRIIIIQEPCIASELVEFLEVKRDRYTYVLTYYDHILKNNSKAKLLMATTSWVKNAILNEKKFSVSTLVGGKVDNRMGGYQMRHDLWRRQDEILIPKDFYLSGEYGWNGADYSKHKSLPGSIVPLSKAPLFDSMFHIAIENTSIKNMFTEKIIDCFQTLTIPIYYGCKNIGNFFNPKGIIQVSSVGEMIDACNGVTPNLYDELSPFIDQNYLKSCKYCVYEEQLKDAILQLI